MFARTDRLLLRPAWAEDAPALCAAIADKRVVRNLAQAPWPYGLDDAERFVERDRAPHAPTSLVFLRTKGAPRLIGCVGFGPSPEGEMDFGYWIAPAYWGLGFATEAGAAAIAHARDALRLPQVVAGHFLDNPASGRVLTKLGFRPTGSVRPRFSAGRGGEALCREFALDLVQVQHVAAPRQMLAA